VPSVYSLKPGFLKLLRPMARMLISMGVTANAITLFAAALSAFAGLFLILERNSPHWFLILPVVFFLRMALNALDGLMAREFNQRTALGAYLNELADVFSDAFLMLPFAYVTGADILWIAIAIVLATISEMAGAVGPMAGASRRYDGPMGKSDRAVVFGALGFWVGWQAPGIPQIMQVAPLAISLLIAVTIVNRVRKGVAEAGKTHA
jgi:CDP-diacylglycerol--glycerol-3-phosphate 3-phosphatidyltransferase